MKYRNLGNSGLKVSVLGLGTNAFGARTDEETSVRVIHHAVDRGITFIDTANVYADTRSEEIIGKAIHRQRHEVILATKVGMWRGSGPNETGASRYHILSELEGSLRRLRTDYVDLYQIHRFDSETPLEETLRTLHELVQSGKVRYIGASNYAAWQLMKALSVSEQHGLEKYVSVQPGYSLLDRGIELELGPLCMSENIGIIPYYPLAGGILTGKYARGAKPSGSQWDKNPKFEKRMDPERMEIAEIVLKLADEIGTTATALSLAWLMSRPTVSSVIAGATSESQIDANLEAVELQLSSEVLSTLDEVTWRFIYAPPFGSSRRMPS